MRFLKLRLLPIIVAIQVVFLLGPLLVVAIYSFAGAEGFSLSPDKLSTRWYRSIVSSPEWVQPIKTSVVVGMAATAVSVAAGLLAAIAIVRYVSRGKSILRLLFLMPLVVPTVVTGMAMLATFQGTSLVFSIEGVILGHIVLTIPYAVFLLEMQVSQINPDLELAANSLGATRVQAFTRVTLPILLPGIVTAAVFVFYNSWEEVVVTSFIAGVRTKTLPLEMFHAVQNEISPAIAALSTLLMVVTLVLALIYLLVMGRISHQRRGKLKPGSARSEALTNEVKVPSGAEKAVVSE